MSNSEEENENFCYYGKPLEPYDEDAFPKRKPISVEDQIATDAQGRRRFHGAFTGGFSAGFFNTVGSLEGWKPQEFKSSREEKAEKWVQKPQDFMDEEDFGQFGIAPQVVKATNEFSTNKKRKKQVFSDGPIPGVPVLHNILSSGNETVGYMLLRNMRMKNKVTEQNELNQGRMYGCEIPKAYEIETMDKNKYETPEIYKEFFNKPKENTFGLGYSGLDKNQFSLFPEVQSSTKFVVSDKNKKISITGQAFGVGAFENDDEDIYSREDISKYDFELGPEKKSEKPKNTVQNNIVLDKFLQSKVTLLRKEVFPPPQIPHSFTGKHKSKRSRFDPIEEEPELPRNQINPAIRARYIGEESSTEYTASRNVGYQNNDKIKQEIIEKENEASKKSICEPSSLYLSDKFVSATQKENVSNILEPVQKTNTSHGTQQMRDAVKIKMFGPLTRITSDWYPCALLCKRFNVPEPLIDRPNHERKRTKNLIFEYQKYKEENQNSLKPGLSTSETPEHDLLEDQRHENIIETKEKPDKEENVTEGSGENIVIEEKIENKNTDTTPVKDITEKIDVEKNLDLFKAVFLSSDSESDDETKSDDKTNEKEKRESDNKESERLKNVVMSDELLTKIKPLKEGILSNIGFHKFSKPSASKEIQKLEDSVIVENCELPQPLPALSALPVEDQYGPKIPDKLIDVSRTEVVKLSSESEEEWVEKGQEKKKKHKKEKKHKKDKKRKKDKKEKRR